MTRDSQDFQDSQDVRDRFEGNVRLAYWCVRRFLSRQGLRRGRFRRGMLDADDLDQVALAALYRAAQTFDSGAGRQFSTYAIRCIQNAILNCLCDGDSLIRIPHHHRGEQREELRVRTRPIHRPSGDPLGLPDRSSPQTQAVEDAEHNAFLLAAIRRQIRPADWECLWAHHAEGQTLAEIGARLGVTREAIRQRIKRAQESVQKPEARE